MPETIDTVREREREREHNSNELSLVNYAQNTAVIMGTATIAIVAIVVVGNGKENTKINRIENLKRMDCIAMKNCYIVRPFCAFKTRF